MVHILLEICTDQNNMRTFRIIAHTADVRVKVAASSLEELFTVSLEGMNQILKRNFCKRKNGLPSTIHQIEISSADTTALLIDFLSEALTLSHIHGAIFCQVEFAELAAHSLTANLLGTQVKSFDEDIKAVSYHEAEIERNSRGNLQTNLVFDI
ncbi:MAG: archease [Chloroflexi bacterium]|nr:archease [Chloroflexota bacterium]